MNKKPDQEPGYLQRVIQKALSSGIQPGITHVIVEHEPNCPLINGGDNCTCQPEITIAGGSA